MGTIDFRAKQQELENTRKELKNTQRELDNKQNELENARNENEDKKSELIEQLLSEIDALKENARKYEEQIASINAELTNLRESFDAVNTNVSRIQDSGNNLTEPVSEQSVTEPVSEQSVTEPVSEQPVTEPVSEQPVTESVSEQPVTESVSEQPVTESVSEQSTTGMVSNMDIVETAGNLDIHTYDGFLAVLNKLLEEIEDTKKGISKKGLSKAGKKSMDESKIKLNQYEKQLKGKKKTFLKQKNAQIYDSDVAHLRNTWEQINKVREDIGMGQWGEYANTASYLYNSPENAKKSNNYQANDLEFNQKFQSELRQGAILNIFNKNTQQANDFFRRIAQGEYTQADYKLFVTNVAILKPCCQRYGINVPINPMGAGGRIEAVQGAPRTSVDYSNMDFGEAFQQGGIVGLIDKGLGNCKNMTPGQRNTWKSIAVLGGYAAGIYGLFKFFTNKKMGFWGKALTAGGVILGSQMLTGENPITLFQRLLMGGFTKEYLEDKFGNAFGDAVDGVQNSKVEGGTDLSGAMYSLMVFNETATVGDVRGRSTKFKNDSDSWAQFRGAAKEKIGAKHFEKFSAVFSEKFDENKWNEWLNSIGIHDGIDDKKLIYELATYKTMNAVVINKFLSDNGVKVTDDKAQKAEYEQYIQSCNNGNKTIDINILETHKNDWFILDTEATYTDRFEDKQNRENLGSQVDQLSLDEQTKSELKNEIQLFYDERPIKNKPNLNDFSLEVDNNLLVLKSHDGEATKINLQNKTLTGFGSSNSNNYEIKFTRVKELLDTAYLTNDILARQRNKQIVDMPPFQYKQERKGICFNDVETLSFNFDTRVLSTGRGGATSKIETLYKNPKEYADYLSKCWLDQNRTNIDGALYQTVKKLSEAGIDFTNELEVKDLENWLKGVKEKLKIFKCHVDGNPFSIGAISKKLEFKAVNGDIEEFPEKISDKFPTLMREGNKEKFLKFMNDSNNKMRGSALSS